MLRAKSAKRYARAFYELASDKNSLEKLIEDFQVVSNTVVASKELKALFSVPMVSNSKIYEIIKAIFKGKIGDECFQCLEFLIHKNRLGIIEDIVADLVELFNKLNNIELIKIFSAFELSQEDIEKIKNKVGEKLGKKIMAETYLSQKLIGGFKIQVKDQVYDFSILSQLEQLKHNFINAG